MRNAYNSFKCFGDVFTRELKRMTSRPIYFYCIVVCPLISLFFFTTLMNSGLPKKMPVGVVDLDHSSNSRNIIRTMNSLEQMEVSDKFADFSEARDAMQRGKIY